MLSRAKKISRISASEIWQPYLRPTFLGLLFTGLLRQVELDRSANAKAGRGRQSGSL